MKKMLIVPFVMLCFSLGAVTPKDVVKQAQKLDEAKPQVECASVVEDSTPLYTPLDALKDIHSGKLVFLGRDLFPGSDQNRTCVYKSETAYILYNNCMGNKKESPATDIEVISFKGGIESFYILNKDSKIPVSTMDRANYDMSWKVSVTPTPAVGNLSLAELKKFKEKYDPTSGGCFIGTTFKAQDMSSTAYCFHGSNDPKWIEAGEKFWKEPGEEWKKTKQYLRKVVEQTKF
jgi:hypothetical protein